MTDVSVTAALLHDCYLGWIEVDPATAGDMLHSWRFVGHYEDGELAAVAMLKGTEIHFAAAPEWRHRITRGRIREFLRPLMARYGFLTTRSLTTDEVSAVFLCRLGFVKTWTELNVHHWMLTQLPFAKRY